MDSDSNSSKLEIVTEVPKGASVFYGSIDNCVIKLLILTM